ncbi:MAG: hypothetical protein QOD68_1328 [Actinomycetota bacterium]|nr:hypothetical protein [Actinomycetota bacterium]
MATGSTKRPSQPYESRSSVGVTGLEPATFRPPDGRATKLRHTPQTDLDSLSDRPGPPDQPPLPLAIDAGIDELRTAVANTVSWRSVQRALGRRPDNGRVGRQLRARCDRLGIDYSHFGRSTRWTEAEIRRCIPAATTWAQVLTELGYAVDSGSARTPCGLTAHGWRSMPAIWTGSPSQRRVLSSTVGDSISHRRVHSSSLRLWPSTAAACHGRWSPRRTTCSSRARVLAYGGSR